MDAAMLVVGAGAQDLPPHCTLVAMACNARNACIPTCGNSSNSTAAAYMDCGEKLRPIRLEGEW